MVGTDRGTGQRDKDRTSGRGQETRQAERLKTKALGKEIWDNT